MNSGQPFLIAAALSLVLALPAGAKADGSGGPGSSSCGSGSFNGLYIGANAGWGWAHADQLTNGFEASGNDNGFTAGVQSGYNLQCGRVVFGIESDFNYLDTDVNSSYPPPDPSYLKSSIDWYGTLRARLGLVHDEKIMLYATGGLAYANVEHSRRDPTFSFSVSDDDRETGWTAGGGIEWLRHANWSLRAEALYVDLGNERHHYTVTTGCGGICTSDTEWDDSFWVARLGLNYRFGPEPQAPLK
jgi:outer membrane immunogenic protein